MPTRRTAHSSPVTRRWSAPLRGLAAAGLGLGLLVAVAPTSAGAAAAPAGSTANGSTANGSTADGSVAGGKCKVSKILVPSCGAFLGVAPTPHGAESYDEALTNFEAVSDRTVDIVHYYVSGRALKFPTTTMLERANEPGRERMLFINWTPDLTWAAVAAGEADDYLLELSQHIQLYYPERFFLSLDAEPERNVNQKKGSGMTVKDYVAFYRHVVDFLHDNGTDNPVMVMDYVGSPNWPDKSWFEKLYPGDKYVDWMAEDPFAFGETEGVWLSDFAGMVDRHYEGTDWPGFYTWSTTSHPTKPVMLAEWGVSEEAPVLPDYKPDFFAATLRQLAEFPQLKALVYWDHPGGTQVGETAVDSSPDSLKQFTKLAASDTLTKAGEKYLGRPADPTR